MHVKLLKLCMGISFLFIAFMLERALSNESLLEEDAAGSKTPKCPTADWHTNCVWPPSDVESLRDPSTNRYDLSLRPWVVKSHKRTWMERYFQLLTVLYDGPVLNGSLVYRAHRMEKRLRVTKIHLNYHLYPQMLDVEATVSAIRNGKQVDRVPITDPSLPVIVAPKHVCQNNASKYGSSEVIILIKSCVRCARDRNISRQTYMQPHLWPNFPIRFVFVTGVPPTNYTGKFHFDGVSLDVISHENQRNNGAKVYQRLIEESNKFGDLLVGDFDDHYFSLTKKQMFSFRWISAFCRHESQLFLFLDSDFLVVPPNLISFVRQLPIAIRPDLSVGISGQNQIVIRPGPKPPSCRWAISKNEFPWPIWPPYYAGAAYMLGFNRVVDFAISLAFISPLRIDDTNLGILQYKLHLPTYGVPHFTHELTAAARSVNFACINRHTLRGGIDWSTGQLHLPKADTD